MLVPQKWWKPWQWIFALVIVPTLTVYITEMVNHFLRENRQEETWFPYRTLTLSEDAKCYLENIGNIPVAQNRGFKVSSMTCSSGNTFIRVETPDEQQLVGWITLERIFPKYVIANIANNDYLFNKTFAQSINKEYFPYLIAQNQENTTICSEITNNIMTYVIKRPDGKCLKEKLNIRTGKVIESKEVSCSSASCN